jgi:flagellar biosynthesis chaperone FliJ
MSRKRDKFRLATVLRVAKLEEEAQQRATAAANRTAEAARLEEAARAEAYAQREERDGPSDAAVFQQQTISNQLRAGALHAAQRASVSASERLELARDDLMARVRKTRTLEDLEERHNIAVAVYAARAAQRGLDDMVRYRRTH